MKHVDYIPTLKDATELRAFGYTGTNKLDAVLRWFRDEQNIHINPLFMGGPGEPYVCRVMMKITVLKNSYQPIDMPNFSYPDYYRAAWAGISRAKHYIKSNKPVVPLKAKITFRQLT